MKKNLVAQSAVLLAVSLALTLVCSVLATPLQTGAAFPSGIVLGDAGSCSPEAAGTVHVVNEQLQLCGSDGEWRSPCGCSGDLSFALTSRVGSGADGSLSVSSENRVVNTYASLVQSAAQGSLQLEVSSETGFSAGDEVLVIQMQHSGGSDFAGRYEFLHLQSVASGVLHLQSPTGYSYDVGGNNTVSSTTAQVVRVPNFSTVSIGSNGVISAPEWDGLVGGIVVFRAQSSVTFTANGIIDVNEKGFRGGDWGVLTEQPGYTGEGFTGLGAAATASLPNSPNPASGGGGAGGAPLSIAGCGGAGGSHGTIGHVGFSGLGDVISYPGEMYGDSALARMYMGAGGGGGGDNDRDCSGSHGTGGKGGGIAMVFAHTIVGANVGADGQQGAHGRKEGGYLAACDQYCGAAVGGGGAGGSIFLSALSLDISSVSAVGGPSHGSIADSNCIAGMPASGAGGVGRVRFDYGGVASGAAGANPQPGHEVVV